MDYEHCEDYCDITFEECSKDCNDDPQCIEECDRCIKWCDDHGDCVGDECDDHGDCVGDECDDHGDCSGDECDDHGDCSGDECDDHGDCVGDECDDHGDCSGDECDDHGDCGDRCGDDDICMVDCRKCYTSCSHDRGCIDLCTDRTYKRQQLSDASGSLDSTGMSTSLGIVLGCLAIAGVAFVYVNRKRNPRSIVE